MNQISRHSVTPFVLGVGAFFACVAGMVSTALSLWRGEAHRRLSIALSSCGL